MEPHRYMALARKWLWLLLVGTTVAGTIGWVVSRSQPRIYRATATLFVNQVPDLQGPDYNSLVASQMLSRTYAQLIKQRPILEAAGMTIDPTIDAATLEKLIDVRAVRDTQLLEVSAEDSDPELARDIVNTLSQTFISRQLADQAAQSGSSRQTLRQQIVDLEREIRTTAQALERARSSPDARTSDVATLQNVLSEHQTTYARLLRQEADLPTIESRAAQRVKIVQPAETPRLPVRPNVLSYVLIASLIGFLAAAMVAFTVEYLDDTVRTESDAQAVTKLRILAAVSRIHGRRRKGPKPLDGRSARSPVGEAYRVLRANIDLAWAGPAGKTLMVTSANAGEGKSTTVANLARVLAEDRREVVAIDADLCKPALHRAFDAQCDRGLSNLLADARTRVEDYLVPTSLPNLRILPSGPIPPNPSELLGSRRFADILAGLRRSADVIVVDAPPILGLVDAAVIARQVTGAILVVESGKTRARDLARATEIVGRSCPRLLGVVLNKVSSGDAAYQYNYYRSEYSRAELLGQYVGLLARGAAAGAALASRWALVRILSGIRWTARSVWAAVRWVFSASRRAPEPALGKTETPGERGRRPSGSGSSEPERPKGPEGVVSSRLSVWSAGADPGEVKGSVKGPPIR